jgi:hypothetical protein
LRSLRVARPRFNVLLLIHLTPLRRKSSRLRGVPINRATGDCRECALLWRTSQTRSAHCKPCPRQGLRHVVRLIGLIFLCSQILSCALFLVLWLCWLFRSSRRVGKRVPRPAISHTWTLGALPPELARRLPEDIAATHSPHEQEKNALPVHEDVR